MSPAARAPASDPSDTNPARGLRRLSVAQMVRASCVASLLSMGLMCWSVLDPTPFPVIISMSVGQAVGTLALLCYCAAVVLAQLQARQAGKATAARDAR